MRLSMLVIAVAFPAFGQEPTSEGVRRPASAEINSVSVYEAGYWLSVPSTGGLTVPTDPVSLLMGGVEAEASLNLRGRRAEGTFTYRGGYVRNHRFEEMSGSDHTVHLEFLSGRGRRTTYRFEGVGESRLISNMLFAPARTLTAAQEASTPGELSEALGGNVFAAIGGSPLELMINGARRRMGSLHARVTHALLSRLAVQGGIGVIRDLRTTSSNPQFTSGYPSVTLGVGDAGITYSHSPRTRLIFATSYSKSYSSQYRFDIETSTLGVERTVGRRSFVRADGGYARTAYLGEVERPGRNGYTAFGAAGTNAGNHTVAASFRRGVADFHGLGADTTIGGEGSWSWRRARSPLALASSLGYERLQIGSSRILNAWVYHATVIREINPHFSLVFDVAYANGTSGTLADFARRGVRLTLVWTPQENGRRR
ncbi:MAG: hypothetical protein JST93_02010 [Acidobacteria bacterium]|nr:hypothetical protein [Acidobacteriota bacterium]